MKRLKRIPSVRAVMTPFPYSVDTSASVAEARAMMGKHGIRHLPVTEAGRLVGVVSDRDLMGSASRDSAAPAGRGLRVGDVSRQEVYEVQSGARLDRVLLEMARRHTGSAVVVKNGRLAGIFTVTDACRCFGELLQDLFPDPDGEDAA